jgi:fatty-acyl-CoA synthase
MAKRKTGKGISKSKAPAKRKVAAKAKKPARRVVKKAAPKKPSSPKKAPAPKKLAPKPVARPGLRRSVKSRTSVTRLAGPRPVSHKTVLAAHNIYERDLDKTPANFAALTPPNIRRCSRRISACR